MMVRENGKNTVDPEDTEPTPYEVATGTPDPESEEQNNTVEDDRPLTRAEMEKLLAERDARIATLSARVPDAMVAANAGGPGVDNHQRSWSLAEQEAAARGEVLDHWVITNPLP